MYAISPLLSLQKKRRNVSKFTVPGANSLWELRPFDDVIKLLLHQKNARNALFIDLDGAEWHEGGLFESFHSDAMCQIFAENFRQIVLLIRCNFRLFECLKFFEFSPPFTQVLVGRRQSKLSEALPLDLFV